MKMKIMRALSAAALVCASLAAPSAAQAQIVNIQLPDLYVDANGNLHYVSQNMDAQLVGGKYAGDSTRPWLLVPFGSGINESSSNQPPNWVCDRNDWFNGGSGLSFCENTTYGLGKGFDSKTAAYVANGTITFGISPNNNIQSGFNVYGPGIATGTTVQTYASGLVTLSQATVGEIQSGTTLTFLSPTTNTAPQNSATAVQSTCKSYTIQTGATQTCVSLGGYVFKYAPSALIAENNLLCKDFTGRKSSISGGGCGAVEFDTVVSGPDDAVNRFIQDNVFSETGESADGPTTVHDGIRIRPSAPNAQNTPKPAELVLGFTAQTMTNQPSGAQGEYGQIDYGHHCDSAGSACFAAISGALTFQTSATANSGQAQIQFALGTAINPGQAVSGNPNIPPGTTVLTVRQCWTSNQLSDCGSVTNATLVTLSANITPSNIGLGSSITFTGAFPYGELFNGVFNDSFVNWTNQLGTGYLKAGTLLNAGTVLDIQGFGEDSTGSVQTDYGDIQIGVVTNTHGGVQGRINIVPANHGPVQIDGINAETVVHPGYVANNWYIPFPGYAVASTPAAPGANAIACAFGALKQRLTIGKLGVKISTVSSSNNTQLAVYSNGTWGRPQTLLVSTSNISTTNTGAVNGNASVQLQPGPYWWCENADNGTVIFTSYGNGAVSGIQALIGSSNQGSVNNTANVITGISVSQTFGTWPNFASGTSWTDVTASSTPEVSFLVSSVP